MADLWGEFGLTLVVLPDGDLGDRVLDAAREWVSLSLISPALWARTSDADLDSKPMRQMVTVLQNDGAVGCEETQVDLFELLSTRVRIPKLRVIRVSPQMPDLVESPEHLIAAAALQEYLSKSMVLPTSGQAASDKYPSVEFLNLVVAPTEFTGKSQRKINTSSFLATFLASPEDRATPLSADGFIRHDDVEKFTRFLLMHLVTVGGLWPGLPRGTLDLIRETDFSPGSVHVSRVFVSGILTDGLAARAVARVLQRVADPKSGISNPISGVPVEGTSPISASQRLPYLEMLLSKIMEFEGAALSFKSPVLVASPDQLKLSLGASIGAFFKFCGSKLGSLPVSLARLISWWFTKLTNKALYGGSEGHAVIASPDYKLDFRDKELYDTWLRVGQLKIEADKAVTRPVSFSGVRSTPALWSDIRQSIFALLDGSNQEKYGFVDQSGAEPTFPIFYRVADLFTDPAGTKKLPDPELPDVQVELGWADFAGYRAINERIEAAEARLRVDDSSLLDKEQDLMSELDQARANSSHLQAQLVARGD